jgi:hypothetical protein
MSTTSKPNSPSKFQTQITSVISGITNDLAPSVTSFVIGGSVMTKAQVLAQLSQILGVLTDVSTAKAAYEAALAARKGAMVSDKTFYANLVMALKQLIGANPSQLAAFGILPPKQKAKPTATQMAIAKAKAKATRALRGTKGKKQRQEITLHGQPTLTVLGPDGQPLPTADTTGPGSIPAPVVPAVPAAPVAPVAPVTPGH